MERINSANTIATEKLPFHTLAKARRVYTRRIKRSLAVLAGSLYVVATIFTVAALPFITVVKIGCTVLSVVTLYAVCAKSRRCRIVTVSANEFLSRFWHEIASNSRMQRFSPSSLGTLTGVCVALASIVVATTPLLIQTRKASHTVVPGSEPNVYVDFSTGKDLSLDSLTDKELSIREISGTWLSADGRYLVDIMSRDDKALFIRFKDKETGLAQSAEIEDEAELELEDVVVRFGSMHDDLRTLERSGSYSGALEHHSEALERYASYLVSAETAPDGQLAIEVYDFDSSTSIELRKTSYDAGVGEP
jgi:hypothetical protein